MKVLVLHAYSRHNSGDGWLVAWTVKLVREALGDAAQVTVIALDPASFDGWDEPTLHDVEWVPLRGLLNPSLWREADLLVAVGGGYLRAQGLKGTAKMAIAHLTQLQRASASSLPSVYMPQSIGPFPRPLRHFVARWLSKLSVVYVRDDRSCTEFADVDAMVRAPDLALLELAASPGDRDMFSLDHDPLWIVRSLPGFAAGRFVDFMGEAPKVAIQSEGRGNDDRSFCAGQLGLTELPLLADVVRNQTPRVVVSVRLHGALLSLLAGWPAVHLSYERKGFGAFGDLGLDQFVENVYSATRETVMAKVTRILEDPEAYWRRVDEALPSLRTARAEIVRSLRAGQTRAS